MDARERTFHELMGELDYPMFIVTTASRDRRAGCLVGLATQTSIHPPRFFVGLSRANRTYRLAQETDVLAVHFVPSDAEDRAELFGGRIGARYDVGDHEGVLLDPLVAYHGSAEKEFTLHRAKRIERGHPA